MPSLKRKKDRKVCDAKVTYSTADAAWAAARALRKSKGVNARAYRCNGRRFQTKHWHITSGSW